MIGSCAVIRFLVCGITTSQKIVGFAGVFDSAVKLFLDDGFLSRDTGGGGQRAKCK